METLSSDDLCHLNHSIQKLYTLRDPDTFGLESLSIVDRLVPGEFPMFHVTHCRSLKMEYVFLPSFSITAEHDRTIHQNFSDHPIVQNMPQTLTGAHKVSDFVSQQELYRFYGLYQQFLRIHGVEEQIVFFLPQVNSLGWQELSQTDTTLIGFAQHRTQRNFTERDRLVLNLLCPHLFQAYTNADLYHQVQQELTQIQQSLNYLDVIILDRELSVKSIAPQAATWLRTYFLKPIGTRQLPENLRSWIAYQIDCLTRNSDLPNACLPLRIQQAGRELTIRLVIESDRDRYSLLLEEQTLSSLNSLVLLGLSQRETEVLALVIQGKNNQAIASQLSVNISTIRKHLENIYSKWGVKSRTEAIAHALAKLGLF
jgi:DNA-binding NarL/FixJ family response regulator